MIIQDKTGKETGVVNTKLHGKALKGMRRRLMHTRERREAEQKKLEQFRKEQAAKNIFSRLFE